MYLSKPVVEILIQTIVFKNCFPGGRGRVARILLPLKWVILLRSCTI